MWRPKASMEFLRPLWLPIGWRRCDCSVTRASKTRLGRIRPVRERYLGSAPTATRVSSWELSANLISWDDATAPCYGPLVQAAMGGPTQLVQGLVVAAVNSVQIQTQAPHNLSVGSAISSGGEIRFVTLVPDSQTAL